MSSSERVHRPSGHARSSRTHASSSKHASHRHSSRDGTRSRRDKSVDRHKSHRRHRSSRRRSSSRSPARSRREDRSSRQARADASSSRSSSRSRSRRHRRSSRSRESQTRHRSRSRQRRSRRSRDESSGRSGGRASAQASASKLNKYSDADNPFGDSSLSATFVWKKKIRADLDAGKLSKLPTKRDLARAREELLHEAEEVQQRREQREEDEQERARLRNEEDRLREMTEGGDWASREREAELRAVKERAEIRLRDKRPTACDVMAQNLLLIMRGEEEEAALAGDARHASHATNPWSKDDLRMGIQRRAPQLVFLSLDLPEASEAAREARAWEHWAEAKCPRWLPWWRDVAVLAADSERRAAAAADGGRVGLGGIPARIESSVLALFEGKSLQELAEVRSEVRAKLSAGRAAAAHAVDAMASGQAPAAQPIDVGYWESVQAALDVWTAQARAQAEHEAQVAARAKQVEAKRARFAARRAAEGGLPSDEDSGMESSAEEEADPQDGAADWHGMSVARLAAAGAGAGEAPLPATAEVGAGPTVGMSAWAAKYKPRKPRYLNRVKTGWNWNHYNKVHYDRDNPPPKVVHGYKFTIFYPDLIDPSVTPTYRLEPADTPEYAILRFSAGPPYEDVAFKIVNRPWNTQPRHGFKCQFERGVLHLWFNFMLDRYRR